MDPIAIAPLSFDQAAAAGALCAAAFQSYEWWARLVPGDERRLAFLTKLFEIGFDIGGRHDAAWGAFHPATGALVGAAFAWVDTGAGMPEFELIAAALGAELSPAEANRAQRSFGAMVELTERISQQPVRHLELLGVEPAWRGRGIGGSLVDHVRERAHRDGMPLRLDTHDPANVPFYERHGLTVMAHAPDPITGTAMWVMLSAGQ